MSDKQTAKVKSKKTMPSSTSGLITFSSVTTADTPSPTTTKPKASNFANVTPVYTGNDGEFAQASKKLIKKDSVTRLKGLSDVIALLKERGEVLLPDFLPYFIYVYCRLAFDNDRQIRDLINQALVVVVSTDKRQLQPFMAKLIGFWWILSCDPFKEIAGRASAAFNDAIPAKKRSSVLLYLAPQILSRVQHCLKQSPTTMSDMTCTTEMEAEEKYERVIVSAIHSLGKLMTSLSEEQNKELLDGVELLCDDSDVGFNNDATDVASKISYRDVFSMKFWLSCFSHKSAPIRKAAFEIVLILTSHCPGVIAALEAAPKVKSFFAAVVGLFNEPLEHNLPAALDAFITLYKNYSFVREAMSLHKQVIPQLRMLMRSHPHRLLDYIVPVLGVVPVQDIALCELNGGSATAVAAEGVEEPETVQNVQSVVGLFTDLLEMSKAVPARPTPATDLLSARTQVSAAELSLLLLLRRQANSVDASKSTSNSSSTSSTKSNPLMHEVFSSLVDAFVANIQSTSTILLKSLVSETDIARHWQADCFLTSSVSLVSSDVELLSTLRSISKVLVQLQRASLQEINLSRGEWDALLWLPLADRVSELLLSILHSTNEDGKVDLLSVSRQTIASVIAVFDLLREGLLVELPDVRVSDNANGGIHTVVSTVATLSNFVINSVAGAFSVTGGVQCLLMSKVMRSLFVEQESLNITKVLSALNITADSVLLLLTSVVSDLSLSLLQMTEPDSSSSSVVMSLASLSLRDVFSFLTECSTSAEGRSKHAEKLLESAVQHNSLSAVSSFLACKPIAGSFSWNEESGLYRWISDVCVHILLEEAAENLERGLSAAVAKQIDSCSLRARLQFLVLVAMTPTLETLSRSLLEISIELWKQRASKIAVLFLLSVLASQLKSGSIGKDDTTSLLPADWMTDVSIGFNGRLLSLFLGRNRGVKIDKRSTSGSSGSEGGDVIGLVCWDDIQCVLLPLLPQKVFRSFVDLLCDLLNSHTSLVVVESFSAEEEGSETGSGDIQPRKWMRHLYGLLEMVRQVKETDLTVASLAANSVDLFSKSYWRTSSARLNDKAACTDAVWRDKFVFALKALQQLESFSEASGEFDSLTIGDIKTWLPFYHDVELFYELLLCLHIAKAVFRHEDEVSSVVTDVFDFCSELYGALTSGAKKAAWLKGLVQLAAEAGDSVAPDQVIRNRTAVDLVQILLNFDLQKSNTAKFQPIKLHSPCYEDRLESGATITYISSTSGEVGVGQTVYQPCEAKVLAVHKEVGSDPYYSIGITEALSSSKGDVREGGRELQTEWYKLLLHHHGEEPDEVSSSLVSSSAMQKPDKLTVFSFVELWLLDEIRRIRCKIFADTDYLKGLSAESLQQTVHGITLFNTIFTMFCTHVEEQSTREYKKAFVSSTVAPLRGLATDLLSLKYDAQSHAWTVGTLLLNVLVSVNLGLGSGLWLPKVLLALKGIVAKETKLKQLSASSSSIASEVVKMDTLYSTLCTTVGCLLSSIQWNTCLQLAEQQLLPLSMPSIPSPVPHLAPSLVKLLKSVWMHQHRSKLHKQQQQQQQQHGSESPQDNNASAALERFVAPYEVEGLDLVLFIFTNGLVNYDDSVRLEAASALHYCFLNRNRSSTVSLLEDSLIREFLPQLESMVICDKPQVLGDNGMGAATEVESVKTWNVMRLSACKLLDTCIVHNIDSISLSTTAASAQKSAAESHKHDSEEDITDEEQQEQELDEKMFRECMSASLEIELERRFVAETQAEVVVVGKLPASDADESTVEAVVEEDESAEVDEDVADELVNAESVTVSTSNTQNTTPSKRRVRYSNKALLATMESNDPYGSVLCWLLCLQRIDALSIQNWSNRARCGNFLRRTGIMKHALMLMIHLAGDLLRHRDIAGILQRMESIDITLSAEERKVLEDGAKQKQNKAGSKPVGVKQSIDCGTLPQLAVYGIYRTVCTLPAMFRNFYNDDCNRFTKQKISQFIEERLRSSIIGREMQLIALANNSGRWKKEEFQIKGSIVSGEVSATFIREETSVEIKIKLPASYPLKNVEVTCTSRIGVSEGRWRRWVLQMIQLLSLQDGSVIDAALMWKANIEKELEGVDPCPICYCILHTKTLSLPTLACPTCNNKFHNTCLYTWFKSSGKSKCVICQQPFFR